MKALNLVDRLLCGIEKTIVSACMMTIASILLVSVLCRHLRIVMVGGEEIAQFAVVWLTFWGMAHCARKGSHIIMSAVVDRFTRSRRKQLLTVLCLFSGCFCLLLSGYACQLTWKVFTRGQVTPALRIPIWYMYAATPAGFFLTGAYYIAGLVRNFREPRAYLGLEPTE
jgi:TRAP-type C4-dicarboxylate transport system permease small subunit